MMVCKECAAKCCSVRGEASASAQCSGGELTAHCLLRNAVIRRDASPPPPGDQGPVFSVWRQETGTHTGHRSQLSWSVNLAETGWGKEWVSECPDACLDVQWWRWSVSGCRLARGCVTAAGDWPHMLSSQLRPDLVSGDHCGVDSDITEWIQSGRDHRNVDNVSDNVTQWTLHHQKMINIRPEPRLNELMSLLSHIFHVWPLSCARCSQLRAHSNQIWAAHSLVTAHGPARLTLGLACTGAQCWPRSVPHRLSSPELRVERCNAWCLALSSLLWRCSYRDIVTHCKSVIVLWVGADVGSAGLGWAGSGVMLVVWTAYTGHQVSVARPCCCPHHTSHQESRYF